VTSQLLQRKLLAKINSMKKISIVVIALLATGFLFKNGINSFFKKANAQETAGIAQKISSEREAAEGDVTIVKKWDLPKELLEVSGIAYMGENKFACIQDEKGVIFIFNSNTGKIEREIPFADPGDFEDLTLAGNTAYAVRSDGMLYEIDLSTEKSVVYKTYLSAKNNIEGLCFDAAAKRLLLAGKNEDENYPGYKCIYAFDLTSKELLKEPAFKIDLSNSLLASSKKKKKNKPIMPSAIGVHPISGDLFITDGPNSRLLQLSKNGDIKRLYTLGKNFQQPEGITFSPAGNIFISNEGKKDAGNITEILLTQ
jgi:uncharacterized protein YjiK